jgi:hypothetical protein
VANKKGKYLLESTMKTGPRSLYQLTLAPPDFVPPTRHRAAGVKLSPLKRALTFWFAAPILEQLVSPAS